MTWSGFNEALDAVGHRLHTERRERYVLAGGKPEDFPDYGGPEEGLDPDSIEWELEHSAMVVRADAP